MSQSIFFEKYTEKLWGISPDKMSSNWAPKRINLRKKHKSFWSGQYSACGKYGAGKIMERWAEMSEKNGVKFLGGVHGGDEKVGAVKKVIDSCSLAEILPIVRDYNPFLLVVDEH